MELQTITLADMYFQNQRQCHVTRVAGFQVLIQTYLLLSYVVTEYINKERYEYTKQDMNEYVERHSAQNVSKIIAFKMCTGLVSQYQNNTNF